MRVGTPNPMSCRLFTAPEAPGRCPASTAVSTHFGTIAGIVTGFFGAGGVSVPEPGAVVMFGVGVVLLRLFTGYAGASIEAHANASDPPMGVTGSIRLREHRCAPSWSLRETLAAGAMLFPLRSGFIGSDVSSQGVDKAYN